MDQNNMQELMKLKKKAEEIQDRLANMHIEAEEGKYLVVISGKMVCIDVKIDGVSQPELVAVFNKSLNKSQEVAQKEMKEIMGQLGLPGMGA